MISSITAWSNSDWVFFYTAWINSDVDSFNQTEAKIEFTEHVIDLALLANILMHFIEMPKLAHPMSVLVDDV